MAEYHIPNLTAGKLDPGVLPDGSGTGADGASAYEVAVANGFVGTEVEWLASLKGEPGDTGGGGEAGPLEEFTGLPADPVPWLPYQHRITSTTALPGAIVWASGEPEIGGWGLIILIWDGTGWRGEWAEMDPTPPGGTSPTEVTASGPTWTDNTADGGGTWTTPTETGITYDPASGTAAPDQQVTVTATAQTGYTLTGATSWSHTFPAAPSGPQVFTDNFNRADGDVGEPWVGIQSGYGFAVIDAVAGSSLSTYRGAYVGSPAFAADQYVEVDLASMGASGGGCIFLGVRSSLTRTGYELKFRQDGEIWELRALPGGDYGVDPAGRAVIASGTFTKTPGQRARIEADGSTIRAFLDGVLLGEGTDTTVTSGQPSLAFYRADTRADNFQAGDL